MCGVVTTSCWTRGEALACAAEFGGGAFDGAFVGVVRASMASSRCAIIFNISMMREFGSSLEEELMASKKSNVNPNN